MIVLRSAAALLALTLAACGTGGAPPAAPAKPAPAPAASEIACPTEIALGGDPLEAESFEGRRVERVCVLGSENAKMEGARGISIKEGDTYKADRARADLDALLHLGTLDDASTFGIKQGRDALVLVYSLRERPRIADIEVSGAKALGDAALTSKIPIERNARFDPAAVNVFAQAIRDEYRTRGYETCTVRVAADLVTDGAPRPADGAARVNVRIVVNEGPRLYFSRLEFKGNGKVKDADLRKAADIDDKAPFDRDRIERASLLVAALYYDRGMVQARAVPATSKPATDGGVVLTFAIEEGDVFSIGQLHATKLGAPVEKELLQKVVRIRPRHVFSRAQVIEDIERIKKFFASRGEPDVEITPVTDLDQDKKIVSITFEIEAPR